MIMLYKMYKYWKNNYDISAFTNEHYMNTIYIEIEFYFTKKSREKGD